MYGQGKFQYNRCVCIYKICYRFFFYHCILSTSHNFYDIYIICNLYIYIPFHSIDVFISYSYTLIGHRQVCANSFYIRRDQFDLLFYGPDRPCFCQKEKNNNMDSPIGYLEFVISLLSVKDKLSLLFSSIKENCK